MKTSKFGRLVSVVVIGTCLIKAVLYGGSKPPATTNTPPDSAGCDAPTHAAPLVLTASRPRLALSAPPPQTENEPSAIPHSSFNTRGPPAARTATGLASTSPTASGSAGTDPILDACL